MTCPFRQAAVVCVLSLSAAAAAHAFPAIQPFHKMFKVEKVQDANVSAQILSASGDPLYLLQCHSAAYRGDASFEYSGDFECRLTTRLRDHTYSTLLTEDDQQSRDWESRGRFFAADLKGRCASIPEFGAKRSFKLRGMRLTLQIADPKFTETGELASLMLDVSAIPDPSANRAIAEPQPIPRSAPPECKLGEYFMDVSRTP